MSTPQNWAENVHGAVFKYAGQEDEYEEHRVKQPVGKEPTAAWMTYAEPWPSGAVCSTAISHSSALVRLSRLADAHVCPFWVSRW